MSGSTIGGIDGSIPLRAGQGVAQPVNPLAQYGQFQGVQNAMNQNKLFQGQVASGQAYQGAIDPQTGKYDPAKYLQLLAANPAAAPAAGAGVESAQSLTGQQLDQAFKKLGFVNNATSALLDKGNPSAMDVYGALHQGQMAGILTPQDVAQTLSTLPQDPAEIQSWARQHQLRAQDAQTQLQQMYGTPTVQNNGKSLISGVTAPASKGGGFSPSTATPQMPGPQFVSTGDQIVPTAGGQPTGPGFNMALSPSEATAPTPIGVTPTGAPLMGTRQQFINQTAGAPTQTGLGPGQTAALSAQGASSNAAGQPVIDAGVAAQTRRPILLNMIGDAGQFVTGPGADGIKNFKATMQRISPTIASTFGIDPNTVAANESFDKLAAQIQNAQGATSDSRYAGVQAANPSSHLSPAGVTQILHTLVGNEDANAVKAQVYNNWVKQNGPGDYQGFEAQFGKNFDPRVFQINRMTPAEKVTTFNGMSATDKQAFKKAYGFAEQNGWLGTVNGGQ